MNRTAMPFSYLDTPLKGNPEGKRLGVKDIQEEGRRTESRLAL